MCASPRRCRRQAPRRTRACRLCGRRDPVALAGPPNRRLPAARRPRPGAARSRILTVGETTCRTMIRKNSATFRTDRVPREESELAGCASGLGHEHTGNRRELVTEERRDCRGSPDADRSCKSAIRKSTRASAGERERERRGTFSPRRLCSSEHPPDGHQRDRLVGIVIDLHAGLATGLDPRRRPHAAATPARYHPQPAGSPPPRSRLAAWHPRCRHRRRTQACR